MAPVTMTSKYLVFGQIRLIMPDQLPEEHSEMMNLERSGFGDRISDMAVPIEGSVILGESSPEAMSKAS